MALALAALAASAAAQDASLFAEGWRWRAITPPPRFGEPRELRVAPEGTVWVRCDQGYMRHDSYRWRDARVDAWPAHVRPAPPRPYDAVRKGWARANPNAAPLTRIVTTPDARVVALTGAGDVVTCDSAGRLWRHVCTESAGLGRRVNELTPSRRGGFWVATNKGVARWNGDAHVDALHDADGDALGVVTALHEDHRGALWLGSGSSWRGALRYDGRWHRVDALASWHVHKIRASRTALWFLLLNGGIARFHEGKWRRFTTADGLPTNRTYDLVEAGGRIFAATRRGTVELRGERWHVVDAGRRTFCLHAAPDGTVYLGSDPRTRAVRAIAPGGDRPTLVGPAMTHETWGLCTDLTGAIWISTRAGPFRLKNGVLTQPTVVRGVDLDHAWPLLLAPNGDIWIGTRGLLRYRVENRGPPRTLDLAALPDAEDDNRFTLVWSGRDAWGGTPADLLQYRWRVEGDRWSPPTRATSLRLPRLAPGTHVVEVQAIDSDGIFEPSPGSVEITVPGPAWAHPASLAGLSILLLAAGSLLCRRAFRRRDAALTRTSLKRFRAMLDHALEGIYLVDPETARIIDVNETAQRRLGHTREELLSMSILDVGTSTRGLPEWRTLVERFRTEGPATPLQTRHRRRDGTTYPVEVTARIRTVGGKEYVLGVSRDVTESIRAEREIRETQETLRLIVNHSSELIYVQRVPSGELVFVSPSCERITGYTPEQYMRPDHRQVLTDHPASRDFVRISDSVVRGEFDEIPPYTVAIRHRDGRTRIVQIHENYVEHRGERHILGIAVDITELYETEEALRHTEKLKSLGIIAGGIAHDFNNLLVGVMGNAELARFRLSDDSPVHEYLGEIESASNRAAGLCRQLLAYAGKGSLELQSVDLSEAVQEMIQLLRVSVPKQVTMEVLLANDLPPVRADRVQLQQIVLNLVTNAAEAVDGAGGQIRVETGRMDIDANQAAQSLAGVELAPGPYAFVRVSDDGCGMDAETRARILDPFFTTKFTGRGLGLAAVAGIVRSHRGGFFVRTEPCKGSVFHFVVPFAETPSPSRS